MELNEEVDRFEQVHERLLGLLKIVAWVTSILFVLAIVGAIRSYFVGEAVAELDDHTEELRLETNEAKVAAVEARDTLQAALDEFEQRRTSSTASSPEAIAEALQAIDRIEIHLCGGPCDADDLDGN